MHNLVELNCEEFFQPWRTPYGLRGNPRKMFENRCGSFQVQHSFSTRTTKAWNSLPAGVATSPSLESYKRRLRSVDLKKFLTIVV